MEPEPGSEPEPARQLESEPEDAASSDGDDSPAAATVRVSGDDGWWRELAVSTEADVGAFRDAIAGMLSVSPDTLRLWLDDKELTDDQATLTSAGVGDGAHIKSTSSDAPPGQRTSFTRPSPKPPPGEQIHAVEAPLLGTDPH